MDNSRQEKQPPCCQSHAQDFRKYWILLICFCCLSLASCTPWIVFYLTKKPTTSSHRSDDLYDELRSWLRQEIDRQMGKCGAPAMDPDDFVRKLVQQELTNRTGMCHRNFAAASAGATVAESSPTWVGAHASKYLLFVPISTTAPDPIIALMPSREVGDCWPMKGSKGHLLVHLAARVFVDGFTIEHVDSTLHLAGVPTEAPNNFTVYGVLGPEDGSVRHLFGVYHYSKSGPARQSFLVQTPSRLSFWLVDLVISQNHGHPKHTCLYRFQVHGKLDVSQCSI